MALREIFQRLEVNKDLEGGRFLPWDCGLRYRLAIAAIVQCYQASRLRVPKLQEHLRECDLIPPPPLLEDC